METGGEAGRVRACQGPIGAHSSLEAGPQTPSTILALRELTLCLPA